MKIFNRLRAWAAILCTFLLVLPPIDAKTKKADKLLKAGQTAEAAKDYDTALNDYEQALELDPKEPAYMLAEQEVRPKAALAHITQGRALEQRQQLDEALVQFEKALLADPSSQVAAQEVRNATAMIKERAASPAGTKILTPAERARQEIETRVNSLEGPPALRPLNNQITSLKLNNQPTRVLFESVGKLAGINVLFDPQGVDSTPGKNFNVDLNNVTVVEALNYIALETHSFWKPISRNAIFVTQESDPKRTEYQDEVVKVFYVQNAGTTNEFTEIFNAVRTGAKLTTGVFSVPTQNAIIARGTPDTIALVEKLLHDLDKPKPEVVVDVIVLEVARQKTINLGAALAGLTGGINTSIQFTPRNPVLFGTTTGSTTGTTTTGTTTTGTTTTGTTTTGTTTTGTTTGTTTTSTTTGTTTGTSGEFISLSQVGHVSTNDFSVSLPGALIQALLTDASSRILQRPQVRVTDNGKASLKIGTKIPYVSGSLNSAVATPGSIPYATTQFQQVDVGTNIDLQPHIHGTEDVSMHIKVEVSSVLTTETIAGVQQPIIEQKVNEADIRMKDGEVSVLGGLYDDENSDSAAGIPGVTNIPALGYLFGNKTKTHNKDEVLIALVPHIVRAPDLSGIASEGVLAGTERTVRVQHRTEAAPISVPAAPAIPQAANPGLSQPQQSPATPKPNVTSTPGPPANQATPNSTTVTPSQPAPVVINPSLTNPPPAKPNEPVPAKPPAETSPPAADQSSTSSPSPGAASSPPQTKP